ncbi:hypothetical protein KGA66_03070 [Actinocrinis puniceicyclus]|uniref:Uncharacterized protein n=1 Tax=Actinocrinis puniceicyclus TaxID=977794 RepID=A0A8J7WM77_9ACTN|nr:hypothetical protein [Actinocrinis puniceicyclus]MBS2962014.1 hypothetical protein [Actinocrinis puniceicyclus]
MTFCAALNLSLLPLALVPTTGVPLASALHLVSLRRLAARARTLAVAVPA